MKKEEIINRSNFNTEAVLKAWGMDLEEVDYLIITKLGETSVALEGRYKDKECIASVIFLIYLLNETKKNKCGFTKECKWLWILKTKKGETMNLEIIGYTIIFLQIAVFGAFVYYAYLLSKKIDKEG